MIRRRIDGKWLLVAHAQHARISAKIGGVLGGALVPPSQPAALVQALALHDSGFASFDANPSLNSAADPAGHNEIPLSVLLDAWASAAGQIARPAAMMMLSLLSLQRSAAIPAGARSVRELFLLNRHQQRELERQQALRPMLGIREQTDLSSRGNPNLTPQERQFLYDYRLMLFAGQLALDVCLRRERTFPPLPASRRDESEIGIRSAWRDEKTLGLFPFPLTGDIQVEVVGKVVPLRSFDHELELHESLATAEQMTLHVRLVPGESR